MSKKLLDPTDKLEIEYRENLVCKLKKITDTFELRDDTFYRSVFLYDYQDRLQVPSTSPLKYRFRKELHDLFEFGDTKDENTRKWKYVKFFESLAVMLLVLKYVESEKTAPRTLDLLKFYWAEKLNLKIKN
jgi:hypothetical protein